MTLGLDAIRSQEHVQVGDLIRRESHVIIDMWRDRVLVDQPKAKRVHHATLLNDLPELLEELGRGLAESDENDARPQCRPARDHGLQRWESGWSLAEVVQDYQLLRLVLLEYLQEVLQRPLRVREVMALGVALDDAIAASVNRYVKSRDDEHDRQADAMKEANRAAKTLGHVGRTSAQSTVIDQQCAQIIRREGAAGPITTGRWTSFRPGEANHPLVDDLLDVSRLARGKVS